MRFLFIVMLMLASMVGFSQKGQASRSTVTVDFTQVAERQVVSLTSMVNGKVYTFDSQDGALQTKVVPDVAYTVCYSVPGPSPVCEPVLAVPVGDLVTELVSGECGGFYPVTRVTARYRCF